jgi:RNA polymerase sigma-70 factor (ECF subfamily)
LEQVHPSGLAVPSGGQVHGEVAAAVTGDPGGDVDEVAAQRGASGFSAGEAGQGSGGTEQVVIATNTCLRALENRGRRPLPTGLGGAADDPDGPLDAARPEVPWLEPFPDVLLGAEFADPATIVTPRHNMRLALIAALQYLPGRQRAVLILRDVLMWRAAEVAELLGVSTVAVNSVLQRARAGLQHAFRRP